jgi:5-hydroxyisourate hydrolase-like protein (transthyretin family)
VNITVTVIDGISGRPAEGVEVTIVGRPAGDRRVWVHGPTDEAGNFTYTPVAERLSRNEHYTVELDVDAYFASFGIVTGYKQVTILVRVASAQLDYRLETLITPYAHVTWSLTGP